MSSYAIAFLVSLMIYSFLEEEARYQKATRTQEGHYFPLGRGYRIFFVVTSAALLIGVGIGLWIQEPMVWGGMGLFLVVGILSRPCDLEITEMGLARMWLFGLKRGLTPWSGIDYAVEYHLDRATVIHLKDGRTFKHERYHAGHREFCRELSRWVTVRSTRPQALA